MEFLVILTLAEVKGFMEISFQCLMLLMVLLLLHSRVMSCYKELVAKIFKSVIMALEDMDNHHHHQHPHKPAAFAGDGKCMYTNFSHNLLKPPPPLLLLLPRMMLWTIQSMLLFRCPCCFIWNMAEQPFTEEALLDWLVIIAKNNTKTTTTISQEKLPILLLLLLHIMVFMQQNHGEHKQKLATTRKYYKTAGKFS